MDERTRVKRTERTDCEEREQRALARQFGRRLKVLREARGWSQTRLGAEVGVHRSYVNAIETGGRNVTLYTMWRIARAFGVPVKNLFDRWEDEAEGV